MPKTGKRTYFEKKPVADLWLVIEWAEGRKFGKEAFAMISSNDLLEWNPHRLDELHTGKTVYLLRGGKRVKASIVHVSPDKGFIETELKQLLNAKDESEQTNYLSDPEMDEDYSGEESEWNPNSEESDSEHIPIIELRRRRRNSHQISSTSKIIIKRPSVVRERQNNNMRLQNNSLSNRNYGRSSCSRAMALMSGFDNLFRGEIVVGGNNDNAPPMTFDQQTQTIARNMSNKRLYNLIVKKHKFIRTKLRGLIKEYREMDAKIKAISRSSPDNNVTTSNQNHSNTSSNNSEDSVEIPRSQTPEVAENILRESNNIYDNSHNENQQFDASLQNNEVSYDEDEAAFNIDGNKDDNMIGIGSGKTMIPKHLYNQIKWNSYTNATRKLLMAVFPRKILATHSLTGKSSPAFANKPAKMQLDSRKTTDIIMAVVQMCKVPENLVRNIITTKCSDENKMYRQRLQKMEKMRRSLNRMSVNDENNLDNQEN